MRNAYFVLVHMMLLPVTRIGIHLENDVDAKVPGIDYMVFIWKKIQLPGGTSIDTMFWPQCSHFVNAPKTELGFRPQHCKFFGPSPSAS